MDKEKILPELQKRIENSGEKITLDPRTISDYVTNISILIPDETLLNDEFFNAHIGVLRSINGNVNHYVAAQVEEAKKNLPNPQTSPATPPATPPTEEKPQWAKDLEEQMKVFKESQQTAQKQAHQNQLIESVRKRATIKDTSDDKSGWAANAGVLETAIRLTKIDDTDTLETIEQKYQQEYNNLCKNLFGSSDAVPGAGGEKSEQTADWTAEKKRLQESGRLPKD